jgi:hypothetical protein
MTSQQARSSNDRVYPVQDDEEQVFSAGQTEAGEQILIGAHPNCSLLAVVFDSEGNVIRVDSRQPDSATAQAAWDALERWKQEVGFRPRTIGVKRFFLSHERTGVATLPEFMHRYLELAPDEGDAGYQPGLYDSIESFIRDEQFVVWWCGKEFWMSREGSVTDT